MLRNLAFRCIFFVKKVEDITFYTYENNILVPHLSDICLSLHLLS